jgi:hypothetical protein
MAKKPSNSNKAWSKPSVDQLNKLVKQSTPTPLISYKLGRSESSVRNKASQLGVSLKPTNKSPYGTKRK